MFPAIETPWPILQIDKYLRIPKLFSLTHASTESQEAKRTDQ